MVPAPSSSLKEPISTNAIVNPRPMPIPSNAERIGLYFVPLQNVILCNARDCFAHKSKKYWYLLLIMMLGLFWIRSMVIFKYGQTVPYEFYWN